MKDTDNGVLFQNADGNINIGVWFNDPDITLEDLCWYNNLALKICYLLDKNEELISLDNKLKIKSCYAELHRNGFLKPTG